MTTQPLRRAYRQCAAIVGSLLVVVIITSQFAANRPLAYIFCGAIYSLLAGLVAVGLGLAPRIAYTRLLWGLAALFCVFAVGVVLLPYYGGNNIVLAVALFRVFFLLASVVFPCSCRRYCNVRMVSAGSGKK